MTSRVVCEQCCTQVPEDERVAADDGRQLCLTCLPQTADDDCSLPRVPAQESCCEATGKEATAMRREAEAALPLPEAAAWAEGA